MPVLLSDRIQQMSESETLAMTRKSRELQAKGADVINLSLGEPDFNTPDFIKQAAKKAIDENYTYYMPVPGYLDLRQAISNKFKNENKLDYSPEQIVVSTGAKQSIANLVLCMVNSGDEVLLPAPYWVSYKEIVKLAGGIPVVIPSTFENDFKINAGILKKYITSKTKLFIFSTPCNPTGSVYSSDELKLLAEVFAANKQVTVIADEIYEYINFKGEHDSIAKYIYDQTVTVNGVSKGFSMTGWRIGYLGAPLEIAKACDKMQGQFTSGASGIAQRAAKAAIEAGKPATVEMCKAFLKRRDLVLSLLSEISGLELNTPDGAFYVFPKVSSYFGKQTKNYHITDANALCMYLLNEAHVAIVPGEAFGVSGYARVSYAASEEKLKTAISRIKSALEKLT